MKIENNSVEELKQGYYYNRENKFYRCIVCDEVFDIGEVYQISNRFFEAKSAVELHVAIEHSDYIDDIINNESKYNMLTANQKQLLHLFSTDMSDKEIAKELNVSISTIRHHKFMFREKAKQAKLYLATYEGVFEGTNNVKHEIVSIHDNAKMVDDRYIITYEERESILENLFSSLDPLKLNHLPVKEKKKVVILTKIAQSLEKGKEYSEKEINDFLNEIFDDYVTLRRYLIDYGFITRTKDGKKYWLV